MSGTNATRASAPGHRAVYRTPKLFGPLLENSSRSRLHRNIRNFSVSALGFTAVIAVSPSMAGDAIRISDAWVLAADRVGGDVALSMTVKNEADAADALMRVRCPVANFSEKHTIDRGEGAPAMRAIPSIPIAAGTTTVLKPDAYHVMLLQTRQALVTGESFNCSIVFQKAGTIETEVKIRAMP
jgi:periplasmic copper chaperone A